jgi:hypothetical protein
MGVGGRGGGRSLFENGSLFYATTSVEREERDLQKECN